MRLKQSKNPDVFELEVADFEEIDDIEDLDYLDLKITSLCKNINDKRTKIFNNEVYD